MSGIIVKPRSRLLRGHDWVHASEILKTFGAPQPGDLVAIKDGRDKFLGTGTYNPASPIPVRRFSRRKQALEADFFRRRLAMAWSYRQYLDLATETRPGRLVWSESDGLPGLIIDRYGPHAVLQTLTPSMDAQKHLLAELLLEIPGLQWVWERNDSHGRQAEGLPSAKGFLLGASGGPAPAPEWEFVSGGVRFLVDLMQGHKTGCYLDQLETQVRVARLAPGRAVLDCFANAGGFALTCARAGAVSVTAVESGEDAAAQFLRNAALNELAMTEPAAAIFHLPDSARKVSTASTEAEDSTPDLEGEGRHETPPPGWSLHRRDVFEFLRQAERRPQRWDLIILDPPSFTRTAGRQGAALRGYRELHLRAARLLAPGGLLATFTCSHHVGREDFLQTVVEGFWDAGKTVRLREEYGQPLDHPILPHLPETRYLYGLLVESLPGR